MAKTKLGSGKRFKSITQSIEDKEGYSAKRAKAITASIGRKEYGKTKMSDLAATGKKRKAKSESEY